MLSKREETRLCSTNEVVQDKRGCAVRESGIISLSNSSALVKCLPFVGAAESRSTVPGPAACF